MINHRIATKLYIKTQEYKASLIDSVVTGKVRVFICIAEMKLIISRKEESVYGQELVYKVNSTIQSTNKEYILILMKNIYLLI